MESEGAWGTEAKACKRLGAMGWMSQALGSVVGWELQVLGAWWAGCFERLGVQRPAPAFAPARASCVRLWFCSRKKNGACLRFNFASESSPKPCKSSTCGFVNALCSGTAHAGFKTQTCAFFWAARDRGATNRVWKQRKVPDARGFPIASGAWGSAG